MGQLWRPGLSCFVTHFANVSLKTTAMPLLTIKELETVTPLFRGATGNSFAGCLMHMLSVDKVNDLYDRNADREGPDFARAVLKDLGIQYEIENLHVLDDLPEGPFITISNHPYGSIDGIILVDLFAMYNTSYRKIYRMGCHDM